MGSLNISKNPHTNAVKFTHDKQSVNAGSTVCVIM